MLLRLSSYNYYTNPDWWRRKRKRDKAIRRARERGAGLLEVSSIVALESYNLRTYNFSGFTCEYCYAPLYNDYELEHIIPLCSGGTNGLVNLVISCELCNRGQGGKHSLLLEEWKPELVDRIYNRKLHD